MEIRSLSDFIYYQQKHHPQQRALGYKPASDWVYLSTEEIIATARQLSFGLLELGLKPADKVAVVVYKNRPEWVILDIALQQLGIINVPVYPTISSGEYEYIFNDAGIKYCFVGSGDLYDKVARAKANVPSLKAIFSFDEKPGLSHWKSLFAEGDSERIGAMREAINPDDLATLIYTSGTTGHPKGVMLSHNNIISNVFSVQEILPVRRGDVVLSFLPLCHIFERTASYSYIYNGVNVVFTGTDNLGGETGDLQVIRPHFFTTVPRLLEKVYEKIYNKGIQLSGFKKTLFFWALSMTDDFEYHKSYSGLAAIKRDIADKLIFSKWRAALGGNIRGILTGAAPCPVKIAQVFSAAGIPIREAYGLTETSPGLTANEYNTQSALLGTVGAPLPGVEIRIDESGGDYRPGEGEILASGPNIMMGYYNKPEKTAEVMKQIDSQQWFCTGDVGKLVDGPDGRKFLKITDRKKELLKTSGGKYVAPAPIENKFKEDFLIEQVMVVGDRQKFVSALIVPAVDALRNWCRQHKVPWKDLNTAIKEPRVQECYQQLIDSYNPQFSHIEQIKQFRLLAQSWEPSRTDGTEAELTPTLKLKRRVILEKFCKEIEEIYGR